MNSTAASTALSGRSDSVERVAPTRMGLLQVFPYALDASPCVWNIDEVSTIGRGAHAEIRLVDEHVSRRHASVEAVPGGLRITDIGSTHGTYVDGRAVGTRGVIARCGSVLRVGHALLLAVADGDACSAGIHRICGDFVGLPHDLLAGPSLWSTWQAASRVSALTYPVLITGESGSGKEAIARVLHSSLSRQAPFVVIDETHPAVGKRKIDATAGRVGEAQHAAFLEASGGVLFFDEVTDLCVESQVALLRLMSEGRVRAADALEDASAGVRVIAATARDLQRACADGLFRRDLYERFSSIVLRLPPLRERRTDIIPIAQSIVDAQPERLDLTVRAAEALLLASWEGNVRQLQHVVARAVVCALGSESRQIQPEHLSMVSPLPTRATDERTRHELMSVLRNAQGNASVAAKKLGVSRATLYNLFKRHGVDPRVVRREPGGSPGAD